MTTRKRNWLPVVLLGCGLIGATACEPQPGMQEGAEDSAAAAGPEGEAAAAGSAAQGGAETAARAPEPRTVTLPAGAAIKVRTTTTLSTKSAATGQRFEASLEEPLEQDGWLIAQKGATVRGVIAEADPGGKVKGVARIAVRLTELETVDGQVINLATSLHARQAKKTVKKDMKKVGIATGVGAAIGAIAGGGKGAAIGAGAGAGAGAGTVALTRGEPAVIPAESLITFTLKAPAAVTER